MTDTIPTQPKILGGTPGSSAGAITAMQLSSIAYCKDIPASLNAYIPEWKAVWIPTKEVDGQFAFIAFNGSQYAVAIRGSILKFSKGAFENWIEEDFNILDQVAWEYTNDTAARPMISKGTAKALGNLNELKDANGVSIVSFLMNNAIPHGIPLCITGHSLGAYLSTAFAPYLHYQIEKANQPIPKVISVFTFAAPTAGNKAFAEEYDSLFPLSWRFYNELDMIPFSATNVKGMADLFPSPAKTAYDVKVLGPFHLSNAILLAQDKIQKAQEKYDSYYSHTNLERGSIAINTNHEVFPTKHKSDLLDWFEQVGAQHGHNTYLKFLGGSRVDCTFRKVEKNV